MTPGADGERADERMLERQMQMNGSELQKMIRPNVADRTFLPIVLMSR